MEEMIKKINELAKVVSLKDQEISYLKGQLDLLKKMIFASKKERFIPDPIGVKPLFDENQNLSDNTSSEEKKETEVKSHTRRGKRAPVPKDLPRIRQEFDLPENEKICSEHNIALQKIGEESVEKLDIIPASIQIIEQITFTYKCPCCDGKFVKSQRDPDPIPKSVASPGLLAYIAISKYADSLPLHRQEKIFSRYGLTLDRTTMARWMIACGNLVVPLINLMTEDLQDSEVIHVDETSMQVLKEPNRRAEQMSYIWCMARSGPVPIVVYKYYDNRGKKAAAEFLDGCHGIVVADAYKVYSVLANVMNFVLAGCMAHCRRKFFDAYKLLKKEGRNYDDKKILAEVALSFIKTLYSIERRVKSESHEIILKVRQEESVPILAEFHAWLLATEPLVLAKSHIGKAIKYALNQWDKLIVFSKNGKVPIDNNFVEGKFRPFVIGRNNWMFATSTEGAHASARMYSLVESAKANEVDPYDYLRLIFKELPKSKSVEDYEKLLPHKVRDHFKLKTYEVTS
jgi:transposase